MEIGRAGRAFLNIAKSSKVRHRPWKKKSLVKIEK